MSITIVSSFLGDFLDHIAQTDYNFIIFNIGGATYGKLPPNVRVTKYLTPDIKPDVVMCYNQQHVNAYQMIATAQRVPLVLYRTVYPASLDEVFKEPNGNCCVYHNLFCASAWQDTDGSRAAIITPGAKVGPKNNKPKIKVFGEVVTQDLINWMAAGNIVVAKVSPEINALIRDGYNGYLYQYNPDALVKKMTELLDEHSFNRISVSAQKTISENYQLQKYTMQWKQLLEKVVNANPYNHRR